MTWQVARLSGVIIGSDWQVAEVRGTLGAMWRVAKISGAVSNAPPSTWRVSEVRGGFAAPSRWRVARLAGDVASTSAPVLQMFGTKTVDPILPVTVTAVATNGVVPDGYTFTSPDVALTVNGNQATFVPPGSPTGGIVAITVTATKGANTSAPQVANFIVNPSYAYSGATHPMSAPYYAIGGLLTLDESRIQ